MRDPARQGADGPAGSRRARLAVIGAAASGGFAAILAIMLLAEVESTRHHRNHASAMAELAVALPGWLVGTWALARLLGRRR